MYRALLISIFPPSIFIYTRLLASQLYVLFTFLQEPRVDDLHNATKWKETRLLSSEIICRQDTKSLLQLAVNKTDGAVFECIRAVSLVWTL